MKKIAIRSLVILGITLGMLVTGLWCVMWICVNGPSERAKELFVLSVRETSAIGFLADIFCSEEEIAQIEEEQKDENTYVVDTSLIKIESDVQKNEENLSGNPSISENDIAQDELNQNESGKDDFVQSKAETDVPEQPDTEIFEEIEFHNVSGSTYKGIMMIVKDPSRVIVGTSSGVYSADVPGKKVVDMIASYGAIGGVNAGGFEDPQGAGNGGMPKGIVISEGELKFGSEAGSYEVIGFNNDNVLVVGTMTGSRALEMGIRDAVSFGPILVVNGEATKASGGGGLNPRTAIGQRADGAVLLLVIDGRQSSSLGASYADITEVMLEFGAINAANLDGGSSSVMYYEGELLNSCSSLYGPREMPTSIVVR